MSSDADGYRVPTETMDDLRDTVQTCEGDTAHEVFKALADERRVLIVRLLDESELCVCDLVELFDVDYSKLSYHLKVLKTAGIVAAEREGNYVTYRLTDRGERLTDIVRTMC